jgi:mannose-6-phosphate isomerase-like protein (cupin superfamily)
MVRLLRTFGLLFCAGSLALSSAAVRAQATPPQKPPSADAPQKKAAPAHPDKMKQGARHVLVTPDELKWEPAPPSLPSGAQMAVLDGNPMKPGPFALRVKLPSGYRVPPHWHPTEENIVILTGALKFGTGDTVDESKMKALSAGSYVRMPRGMRHYVEADGETTFHMYGTGPFAISYVNPKDDPRKKS